MTERSDVPDLTNPRAERVRSVRALSGRSARSRTGLFLVEGPQGVREAVRFAPERVRDIYVSEDGQKRFAPILVTARSADLFVHVTSQEVLAAMSPDAQGILVVARRADPELGAVLATEPKLVAILSNVRDPGNAGTVIRAADAAGADAVILTTQSVDIHNPKTVRSTAGSLFHLPVVTGISLADVVADVQAAGLSVLATDGAGVHDLDDLLDMTGSHRASGSARHAIEMPPNTPAVSDDAEADQAPPDLVRPTAWLFGNEAWGLHPEERALADAVVRVPIRGAAESLNLAAAATLCLYASSRAQR